MLRLHRESGGTLRSVPVRTYDAAKTPKHTLKEKLLASGTFAPTQSAGSSGEFVGWFNSILLGECRQCMLGPLSLLASDDGRPRVPVPIRSRTDTRLFAS